MLAPVQRGPWASRKAVTRWDYGEGLDGPDYDPGAHVWADVLFVWCGGWVKSPFSI